MGEFHQSLAKHASSHGEFRYYYVTAWEMAALVKQAEQGLEEPDFDFAAAAKRQAGAQVQVG
jgi:hypothetical protein